MADMSADIIDLRAAFAGARPEDDVLASARRVADTAFWSALALLDQAYGREYRRLVLTRTLYAMEHADEAVAAPARGD